jgi:hypothetical protein
VTAPLTHAHNKHDDIAYHTIWWDKQMQQIMMFMQSTVKKRASELPAWQFDLA